MARKPQTETTENTDAPTENVAAEKAAPKSIVPAKYAGKYKGAQDALSNFIGEQCNVEGKLDFAKFFDLARANDVHADQIAKYEGPVSNKVGGAAGRARMSLGNILRGIARKGEGLKGLDNETYDVKVEPLPARTKAETEKAAA